MRKAKAILILCLVVVMVASFPLTALAGTVDDVKAVMRDIGSPEHFVNLFANFLKGMNASSAQIDELLVYANKVKDLLGGKDPYTATQEECLQVLEWGTEAAKVLGLTLTYEFTTDKVGANIYLWDANGKLVLKFHTRDTGVVQTGYPEYLPVMLVLLLAAAGISIGLVAKKKYAAE